MILLVHLLECNYPDEPCYCKEIEELEKKQAKLLKEYESKEVPRPKRWGGYIVKYETVEIWQGRPNRLHDRFEYQIDENKNWSVTRLSP